MGSDVGPPEGREFFTVGSESGRLGFLVVYGAVGSLLAVMLADGWWLLAMLATGAVVGGLMAWQMYGYSHLWLDGLELVEQTPVRVRRIPIASIRELSVTHVGARRLVVASDGGSSIDVPLEDHTESIRYELGQRLKVGRGKAFSAAQRRPSVMRALGLLELPN